MFYILGGIILLYCCVFVPLVVHAVRHALPVDEDYRPIFTTPDPCGLAPIVVRDGYGLPPMRKGE